MWPRLHSGSFLEYILENFLGEGGVKLAGADKKGVAGDRWAWPIKFGVLKVDLH